MTRAADRLRKGELNVLHDAIGADYQPTIIALLFTSLWDMASLPPREAPRYGWWQANETQSDRLWQGYTKNLNWEISRGFDPDQNIAVMLNRDAKSSRASYIATFFYLFIAMNDSKIDGMLTVWLLEQLVEDVQAMEQDMVAGLFSRHLWLWSVLFGAAVADSAEAPVALDGSTPLDGWRTLYASKLRLVSQILGLTSWEEARQALAVIAWIDGSAGEAGLRVIWERAVSAEVSGG